ncbi:anthranilate synthase component I [uncultured Kocuria sp.]|uniref:anthranilate synthase component I n=1 Tax=uncultured Kocuria sp. TaxID=259305 RepID=UPI0025966E04|nr:anthranilate synthase component I [uncultured Kocuria sp.]
MKTHEPSYSGKIRPTREEFRQLAEEHRVIPVTLKVVADSMTPIGLYRSLVARDGQSRPGTFLLESANEGAQWSRYSFIGVSSRSTLTTKDGKPHWQGTIPEGAPTDGSPVDAIRDTLEMLHTEAWDGLPPLTSGLVGYLGWDTVRHWEKLPHPPTDDVHLPEFALNLVSDMAIHDHHDGSVTLVANAINWNGTSDRVDWAYDDAVARLTSMIDNLAEPLGRTTVSIFTGDDENTSSPVDDERVHETWSRQQYMNAIVEAKHAIVDGDIFQVVISRRFEADCPEPPLDVYRVLRQTNPSPYMYLYTFEDPDGEPYSIVGSSPEALVTVHGDRASTHPIAGSRPRGKTHSQDVALAEELLADEKEKSEHLMLVDLSRNDLSKIATPGTVAVTQFMEVERFSHIMHISSTVEAHIRDDAHAYDVLRATFPAGTLSGAPKPRAMQLLDDYEPHRRGVYAGVVGYFDFAGNMDMAIAIRTALLRDNRAFVQAGAGIVADSQPETEADESVSKAAAPLKAALRARDLTSIAEEEKH